MFFTNPPQASIARFNLASLDLSYLSYKISFMYVLYPKTMGSIDALAEKKYSIPSIVLMENAGIAVCNHILDNYSAGNVLVLCGPGNNGGDGFVVSRHLANKHYNVHIGLFSKNSSFTGNAKTNMGIARKMRIPMFNGFDRNKMKKAIRDADLIVDGVFGTGFHGELNKDFAGIFQLLNESKKIIVSIDIPSGVNGLTGQTAKHALHAKSTVSFAALKTGVLWNEAMLYAGDLYLADISIPDELIESKKHFYMLDRNTVQSIHNSMTKRTKPYAHKMEKGKLMIIGGGRGMQGAPQMSAISAIKSGAGISYVYLIEKGGHKFYPETVFIENYAKLIKKNMPVIIGPGMGRDGRAKDILIDVLKKPNDIIIDADAINILSGMPKKIIKPLIEGRILTPHPEEFRRLSGYSFSNIEEKIRFAERFAHRYNVLLVLKSPPTIVTDGKSTFIFPFMSPKLATAGSGDVLCGIIGGMMASGIEMFYAALMAVYVHFLAGVNSSAYAVSADDIVNNINNAAGDLFK